MTHDRFKTLLEELDGNSLKTLTEKNARYSAKNDALHNFRSGGEVFGGTSAQACWGYLTKHLVALRDMVQRDDFSNREDFLEKCQDSINYIRFLWCIGNEKTIKNDSKESDPIMYRCHICGKRFDPSLREDIQSFLQIHLYLDHCMEKPKDIPTSDFVNRYFVKEYE